MNSFDMRMRKLNRCMRLFSACAKVRIYCAFRWLDESHAEALYHLVSHWSILKLNVYTTVKQPAANTFVTQSFTYGTYIIAIPTLVLSISFIMTLYNANAMGTGYTH